MKDTTQQNETQLPSMKMSKEISDGLKIAFDKCSSIIGKAEALKELGFASQIISKSPTLQKCSIQSVIDAVVNSSRVGITLNPTLRLAYLVPRKNTATLEISYMGLITILKKSGGCKYIEAHIVYQDEAFEYNPANNTLSHTIYYATTESEHKQRKAIGCYSRAVLITNEIVYCFMPMWEIEKVKRFSEGSDSKWSAWQNWEEEMIKKSVIKRHFKTLVNNVEVTEVIEALRIEDENNPIAKQSKPNMFNFDFEE
ncbi:hypothetical protein EB118_16220 [bacterium]|nr:hypothetical protein [Alphaproteobacteria bacterium]NDD84939.1 hypothetical protein [bacterium]NDG31599.1 hypothetical protein [bacterium]